MSQDNCPVVECFRPECRNKCGTLKWFGNLSDCDVALQYKLENGDLYHSLGEYAPGRHVELGGGVLLLPSTATVRAINTKTGQTLADWGSLGAGMPTLYIDSTMCSQEKSSALPSLSSPVPSTIRKPVPRALRVLALGAVILALVSLVGYSYLLWIKRRAN